MNDDKYSGDLHAWIEPEIEARVVALILGEASAFEAEELERLMEERPEIRTFKRRLEVVHGLIAEVSSPQDDEEWQLAPERRAELFEALNLAPEQKEGAVLETDSAAREKRIRKAGRRMVWGVAACFALTLFLFLLVSPIKNAEMSPRAAKQDAERAAPLANAESESARYFLSSEGQSAGREIVVSGGAENVVRVWDPDAGESRDKYFRPRSRSAHLSEGILDPASAPADKKPVSSIRESLQRMKENLGDGEVGLERQRDQSVATLGEVGGQGLERFEGRARKTPAAPPAPSKPGEPAQPAGSESRGQNASGYAWYAETAKGEEKAVDQLRRGSVGGKEAEKSAAPEATPRPAAVAPEFGLAKSNLGDELNAVPALGQVPVTGTALVRPSAKPAPAAQPASGPVPAGLTDEESPPAPDEAPDADKDFGKDGGGGIGGGGGGGYAGRVAKEDASLSFRSKQKAAKEENVERGEWVGKVVAGTPRGAIVPSTEDAPEAPADAVWADSEAREAGRSGNGQPGGDFDGDGIVPPVALNLPNSTWSIPAEGKGAANGKADAGALSLFSRLAEDEVSKFEGKTQAGGAKPREEYEALSGFRPLSTSSDRDEAAAVDINGRVGDYEFAARLQNKQERRDLGTAEKGKKNAVPVEGADLDAIVALSDGAGDPSQPAGSLTVTPQFGPDASGVEERQLQLNNSELYDTSELTLDYGTPAPGNFGRVVDGKKSERVAGEESREFAEGVHELADGFGEVSKGTDAEWSSLGDGTVGNSRDLGRSDGTPGANDDRRSSDRMRAKLLKEVDAAWEEAVPPAVTDPEQIAGVRTRFSSGIAAADPMAAEARPRGGATAVSGAGGYTTHTLEDGFNLLGNSDAAEGEAEHFLGMDVGGEAPGRGLELLSQLSATLESSEKSVEDLQAKHWGYLDRNAEEVNRKLNEIIIPEVVFTDTTVTEALAYLQEQARSLDLNELDESKKGLSFSVRKPRLEVAGQVIEEELDAEGGLGISDPGEAKVKELKLKNVPLGTALQYLADQTRTRYKVEDGGVKLVPLGGGEGEDVLTRAYRVSEPVWKKIQGGRGQEAGQLVETLKDSGIDFPPGASATYVPSSGTLVVSNTPTNLDLVSHLVENTRKNLERESEALQAMEKSATDEPFSTFSLHVSDVSFKLAKASLAQGIWPEAEKIRVEEFVNAFDYGDPAPTQEEKVACQLEQAAHPFMQQRNLLRVSMRTAALGRSASTPLRLTVLLDNSGSMDRADRVESVKNAFDLLAAQLNPQDQITLISFARAPRLVADRVKGQEAGQLSELVDRIPSEGGTNLEEALRLGVTKAKEQFLEGGQNRIILLTDGAANLGNAKPAELGTMVEQMRQQGIAFDACGVGAEGLNDDILESLTRKGDGRYYFLDNPDDADEGFAKQIAGALRPAAKNVKVQVEFNPKRVGRYKLYGFEKHRLKKEDFRNDSVDAAELAAEEAGNAIYQFEALPEGEGEIGTVSVRFQDTSSGQMVEKKWTIPYDAGTPRLDDAQPSMRLASGAALLGEKLKGSIIGEGVEMDRLTKVMSDLPGIYPADQRVKDLMEMTAKVRELSTK